MNILNEEIRVIQTSMAHIERAIPLAVNDGERVRLKDKYNRLNDILQEKLNQCGDYKG